MTVPEVSQIYVGGNRRGVIDLKRVLKETAEKSAGKPDDEIADELLNRLSQKNYITPGFEAQYRTAFLREYKKFRGEPVEPVATPGCLQIKVLGPGCPNCERLEQDLMTLMTELNISADLEHVRDPVEISAYGVMSMPALVIDGQVKAAGRLPSKALLKEWIEHAAGKK
jgi:small redox-active disulfide protein 2